MNGLKLQATLCGMNAISAVEKIAFQKKNKLNANSNLFTNGFAFGNDELAGLYDFEIEDLNTQNSYFHRKILTKQSINEYAEKLLSDKNIRTTLEDSFGAKFCIGYISDYITSALPDDMQDLSVYANHWHIDTLLSKNAVKIMILPEPINEHQGPLQFLSQDDTDAVTDTGFYRGESVPTDISSVGQIKQHCFTGENSRALFIRSHSCMHRAGVPEPGYSREQIMIQLNPAKQWSYHTDLYERQFSKELTLPLLKNSFRPSHTID